MMWLQYACVANGDLIHVYEEWMDLGFPWSFTAVTQIFCCFVFCFFSTITLLGQYFPTTDEETKNTG